MLNNSQSGVRSLRDLPAKVRPVLTWIRRHAAIEIAVLLALAVAADLLGRHLLDSSVPADGDVRAHIFKIQLLQDYLARFSWPQWNQFWYHGIPEDQFYPPGFYFLGAVLGFISGSAVVAYKVLLMLAMVLNGAAIFYFARRFLGFAPHPAIWCLAAFQTSTPLLVNFMYGEGPNLLGWSLTIFFLTVYMSQVMENKTAGPGHIVLAGLLLGAALLVHPFPVIFAAFAVFFFHAAWLLHNRRQWKIFLRLHLPYLAGVVIIGAVVGMYYWLPAFLTLDYSSSIYSFTEFMWKGGTIYLLAIVFLALAVSALTRWKIRDDPRLDALILSFCAACVLGFGGTSYLPFGLGGLVQEFRFACIVVPFLAVLLIAFPLQYRPAHITAARVILAAAAGIILTAFIFGINSREALAADFQSLTDITPGSLYAVISEEFAAGFPAFAVTMFPYISVILFLALSFRSPAPSAGLHQAAANSTSHSPRFIRSVSSSSPGTFSQSPSHHNGSRHSSRPQACAVVAGGICLLLLTSFIPYINTSSQVNLGRLEKYINNYQQPQYAELMRAVQGARLIVPINRGYLTEGDNPVTFAHNYGVETVNGPYNQGDPKFFKFTVHLEWSERWILSPWTRENLMQESAARYIFVRDNFADPGDTQGLTTVAKNNYGRILALVQTVAYAEKVTPVLVDSANIREITEFFNILMPQGYKMVLVNIQDVPPELVTKFRYVMVDDASKASAYQGQTVFLLKDDMSPSLNESRGIVHLNVPYLYFTNQLFYHGDEADGYMWLGWDGWPGAQLNSSMQKVLEKTNQLMTGYLNKMDYIPVDYALNETRITVGNTPGFTLIKNSYFPYWESPGNTITTTTQGFMLLYSESPDAVINYRKPLYYIAAAVCTVFGLLAAVAAAIVLFGRRRAGKPA